MANIFSVFVEAARLLPLESMYPPSGAASRINSRTMVSMSLGVPVARMSTSTLPARQTRLPWRRLISRISMAAGSMGWMPFCPNSSQTSIIGNILPSLWVIHGMSMHATTLCIIRRKYSSNIFGEIMGPVFMAMSSDAEIKSNPMSEATSMASQAQFV